MRFDGGVFDVWCMFIYPVQSATWCSRCGLMVVCLMYGACSYSVRIPI